MMISLMMIILFAEWLTGEKCLGVQRFSPSQISDTPRAGFQSAQNLSSDYDEWSCAVVITTTLLYHKRVANVEDECHKSQRKNKIGEKKFCHFIHKA